MYEMLCYKKRTTLRQSNACFEHKAHISQPVLKFYNYFPLFFSSEIDASNVLRLLHILHSI